MNLPFMQYWPDTMPEHMAGKPTLFPQKIWSSGIFDGSNPVISIKDYTKKDGEIMWDMASYDVAPKLHTIRKDSKSLWKSGRDIHFWINYRTPSQFQFAPIVKCCYVQRIWITNINVNDGWNHLPDVFIDGHIQDMEAVSNLAKNDGFDSVWDFFEWFKEDFTGTIIHWTDLKY